MREPETAQAPPSAGDGGRAHAMPPGGETRAVVDLTDEAVARHGGPVLDLAAGSAGPASVRVRARTAPALLRPLGLLVAVNALNVLDAALTVLWIEMGIAVEGNPLVDAIGFPAKVVVVAVGSYVVYRLRPRWLLVPVVALAAVCAYHLVGAAVVLGG